jgi:Yip1 domain
MTDLIDRAVRAAKLDASVYEEVEADKAAIGQAMTVVVVSSVAAGIGSAHHGILGLLIGAVGALVGWYVWAFITHFVGTKFLPESQTDADVGELLRTTGFSSSPGVLRVLGIIPGLTAIVFFVVSIWMLVAMVIAVRQALDYTSTGRAVGVCAIGWLFQMLILILVFTLVGLPAVGVNP